MKPMDQMLDTTETFFEEFQSHNVSNQQPKNTVFSRQHQDSDIRTLFHTNFCTKHAKNAAS